MPASAPKSPTVLLVDDEFATLEVLALMLESEGYSSLLASNGKEALSVLERATIDLVITDYKMPKMDGVELCARMTADERFRHIPVILCSATYGQQLARPAQVVAFFGKPLLFAKLLETLRSVLPIQSP